MNYLINLLGSLIPIALALWILYIIVSTYAVSKNNSEKLDEILQLLKKDNNKQE